MDRCYRIFDDVSDRKTLVESKEICASIGGGLAVIRSREEWWKLMKAVSGGGNSFWISETSSEITPSTTNAKDGAQIEVINRHQFHELVDGGVIVNLMNDFRQVPPQWDIVDKRQRHRFVCEV